MRTGLGGSLYVLAGVFVLLTVAPRLSPAAAALSALAGTSLVELLQLWHPPFLQAARATRVGQLVLGSTFAWTDFPFYLLGALLGLLLARCLAR